MKPYILVLLIALLFLPIAAVFLFDARFSHLENSICSDPRLKSAYTTSCSYPERNQRDPIVTTAFYRHVADYFGREDGTSPSWLDLDTGDANSWFSVNNDAGSLQYEVHQRIGTFNREFAMAMIASIMAATVSATLLAQELLGWCRKMLSR